MTDHARTPLPRWGIFLFLTLMIVLVGCNGDSPPVDNGPVTPEPEETPVPDNENGEDEDDGEADDEEPDEGGSLVVAMPNEPDTLNFSLTTNPTAHWILSAIDARMIRIVEGGSLEPQLLREIPTVENGGISEDGLTYTIRFLPDVTWSDGEPLDANDFRFTWETLTDAEYPAASVEGWDLIEDVTVSEDELSAVIRLRSPSANFVRRVLAGASGEASGFLLPEHVLEDLEPEEIIGAEYGAAGHVGAGPFTVVEWSPGDQIVIERTSEYWDDPPLLDRIVFRFPETSRDAVSLVTTGDVDLTVALPATALLDAIESDETNALITPKAGALESYAFNLNDPQNLDQPHPIFGDRDVRRAIVMGFNRQAVVENILLDQTSVPATPLSDTRWEYEALEPIPFDPEQAAELLDQAGWTLNSEGVRTRSGQELAFTVTTVSGDDPEAVLRQRVQEAFIEDMANLGIQVEAANYALEQIVGTEDEAGILAEREFDLIDLPDETRSSLDTFVERFSEAFIPSEDFPSGANVMGYQNEQLSQLLRQQAMTLDPEERQELLNEAQEIVTNDVPLIMIYNHIQVDMSRQYVHGLEPGPVSGLWWNVDEWWISREDVPS